MAKDDPAAPQIAGARRRLAHLGGLAKRAEEAERRILAAAEDRIAAIDADLAKLRPRVDLDDAAADRFMAMTAERGQCQTVAAKAQKVLGA